MENKKSLLIIFILIITAHIVLFANMKIEEKVVAQSKPQTNPSKINLKNVVIKKPEPKPEPVVQEVVETPVEVIKPLPKTKSKNIIKEKKKPKKKIKKPKKPKKKIEKKVKKQKETKEPELPKKQIAEPTTEKVESSQKTVAKKPTIDPSQIQALEDEYLSKLRYLIEKNKIYPRSAKRLRQTGKVVISFVITKNGHIKNANILNGSKYKRLNKAAIEILDKINKFDAIPEKLNKDSWKISVPIVYEIRRS